MMPTPALALSAVIDIAEKYSTVEAGEKIYFLVAIKYPENTRRKDLRIIYEINKDGKLVTSAKFLKAIETQASFMDSITIPELSPAGIHTVDVQIMDYDSLSEEVSKGFTVITSRSEKHTQYFYLTIISIILMNGALLIILLRRRT